MGKTQQLGTLVNGFAVDANGNVGIGGAANASYKLAVTGASLFSSSVNVTGDLSLFSGGTANNFNTYALGVANTKYLVFGSPSAAQPSRMWSGGIGADSSENIFTGAYNNYIFGTGSSLNERMRITSSGNVGIGTTNPLFKLDVIGGIRVNEDGAGTKVIQIRSDFAGVDPAINVSTNNALLLQTNNTERMRITSSGNVGIATTTPMPWAGTFVGLSVGQASVGSLPNTANSYFTNNIYYDGSTYRRQIGDPGAIIQMNNDVISFANVTYGTAGGAITVNERMRITSAGYVGIGTSSPVKPLQVNSPYSLEVVQVNNTRNGGSNDYGLVTTLGSNDNNTSNYHYIAATGGADKCYIYGNGNIVNTNGSYGTLSDATLKENIVDATSKLDDLLQLKVRNFNLIDDENKTKQIGFIAQEFEEVFPAMVDTDGKSGMKTIKTSVLVPMLVKAIQELSAKVTALENK